MTDKRTSLEGAGRAARDHVLQIEKVDLVGGGRSVTFSPGLNIVRGDITTGKTTFVRLLRALLGTVPGNLPPEVGQIRYLRGSVTLGSSQWMVVRPVTTTRDAVVELARRNPSTGQLDEAVRVPSMGADGSYSRFLLERLSMPVVSVPKARRDPLAAMSPVSASDWLGYCIVTGDELDAQVFGHLNPWRDQKRRWIFELVYGFYDRVTAILMADLRHVELRLDSMEHDSEIVAKFLAGTPFGDRDLLEQALAERRQQHEDARHRRTELADVVTAEAESGTLRTRVVATAAERDRLHDDRRNTQRHLDDLDDLRKQLHSQSARLTRAIVADEWLVDFEFVVCPRCGSDIEQHRAAVGDCYLCTQPEHKKGAPDALMAEQNRLASQILETDEVIESSQHRLAQVEQVLEEIEVSLAGMSAELDARTASFVSARTSIISQQAEQAAALRADIDRLSEYLQLIDRHEAQATERAELAIQADELRASIEARTLAASDAEDHVAALEDRLLEYLEQLHVPQLGELLTVKIARPTWLPEISGRSFDELSSQGLKTLVNAAHALAHHTVAIDRGLPMPGLLVLDGLSANAGREGLDGDRIEALYRLLQTAATDYEGLLQIIAVDNEIPSGIAAELTGHVVLTLSQDDRLIQSSSITNGGALDANHDMPTPGEKPATETTL
jgi:hypothetical protein